MGSNNICNYSILPPKWWNNTTTPWSKRPISAKTPDCGLWLLLPEAGGQLVAYRFSRQTLTKHSQFDRNRSGACRKRDGVRALSPLQHTRSGRMQKVWDSVLYIKCAHRSRMHITFCGLRQCHCGENLLGGLYPVHIGQCLGPILRTILNF
jgi:hypothetical protein